MSAFEMPAAAHVERVVLRVEEIRRVRSFYRDVIGLRVREERGSGERGPDAVELGTARRTLVELRAGGEPSGGSEHAGGASPGLYHLALRVDSRPELGRVLRHLRSTGWPLRGGADHGVSEAVYLTDPEGNGVELYADRPRPQWPRGAGELAMGSDPLDVPALLAQGEEAERARGQQAERAAAASAGASSAGGEPGDSGGGPAYEIDPATRVGHVHLRVVGLEESERFYAGLLGFRVTQRSYPGALFFAAGDYHHHVGVNVWGRGGSEEEATFEGADLGAAVGELAPRGAPGLLTFEIALSDRPDEPAYDLLDRLRDRLDEAGAAVRDPRPSGGDGRAELIGVRDPSGIPLRISA